MEDYALEHPVTGKNEKNVSCITLLLTWDRSDNGRARSFQRLSLRLSEIGRRDLSDKLSQLVYDEKSDEVSLRLCCAYKKCKTGCIVQCTVKLNCDFALSTFASLSTIARCSYSILRPCIFLF